MCTSFFDHQPALVEDVSGKGRRRGQYEGQESANFPATVSEGPSSFMFVPTPLKRLRFEHCKYKVLASV